VIDDYDERRNRATIDFSLMAPGTQAPALRLDGLDLLGKPETGVPPMTAYFV
jgi:hypothetical protein